jgi:hypothetical protein
MLDSIENLVIPLCFEWDIEIGNETLRSFSSRLRCARKKNKQNLSIFLCIIWIKVFPDPKQINEMFLITKSETMTLALTAHVPELLKHFKY